MANLMALSRKIHRMLVLIMLGFIVVMAGTGSLMKFPSLIRIFPFMPYALTHYLHSHLSTYFTVVLLLMAATGSWMYFYPLIRRRRQAPPPQPPVIT